MLDDLVAQGQIAPDWAVALRPVQQQLQEVVSFVRSERDAGFQVLPADENIFAAYRRPLSEVRVLIIGQDPYPTPGHSMGLAFSTTPSVRPIPRSLTNMYRELSDDLGVLTADHGDLSTWADEGVMLLNRVLTVRAGEIASHRRRGWEQITEHTIRTLVNRGGPLVAVLWGKDAQLLAPLLGDVPIIASAHPSPLSARRGFFGSRPFSRVNTALKLQNQAPVDWRLAPQL